MTEKKLAQVFEEEAAEIRASAFVDEDGHVWTQDELDEAEAKAYLAYEASLEDQSLDD